MQNPAGMTITRGALLGGALVAGVTRTAAAQTDKLVTVRYIASMADDMRSFLYAQSAGLFHQAGLDVVYTRAGSAPSWPNRSPEVRWISASRASCR